MSSSELEAYKKVILKTYHNTYVYAKHLCENLLNIRRGSVPLVMSRPSIVGAAWKDPFPGWVCTLNACGLFMITGGTGIINHTYAPRDCVANNVPIDFCTD